MIEYERETVALLRQFLDGDIDGELMTDDDLADMWAAHSAVGFASWLVHDGITKDMALGMVRGWAARMKHDHWQRQEGM